MMKTKEVLVSDSENGFDVDELEEVADVSDHDLALIVANIPGKRGQLANSTSNRNKKPKISEEEMLYKNFIPAVTSARILRATEMKIKQEIEDEEFYDNEYINEDVEDEKYDGDVEDEKYDGDVEDEKYDGDVEDEKYDEEEESEEELNQGPGTKPSKDFTNGAFVVLKTDMIDKSNPSVWKIDGKTLLQKYNPFKRDGKVFYRSTTIYSGWGAHCKVEYYSAPVSFIMHSRKEHIIEFYKDKIKIDLDVKRVDKKELEEIESELSDDENVEPDEA